ncbi:MAG: protein-glutamate O-methyltransferase CheR [Alphaproteobacteria bacterium]
MKPEDFNLLSGLLRERSGLVLTPDKGYLLESRLVPLARKHGMAGLDDLVSAIRSKLNEPLLRDITEAMTTNESFFFRDTKPFDNFRKIVLPALLQAREAQKRIRIWCAACSNGQEPYSLAMILREEAARLNGWRVEIVGTDISREVLQKALSGIYSQFEVQRGLPIQLLVKYFAKVGEMWQVDPSLRAMVQFKELNLLRPFGELGVFDVVFCRNVLIYFDQAAKADVLQRIAQMMPQDGFLFLGGAETVIGVTDKFVPHKTERSIYTPAGRTAH